MQGRMSRERERLQEIVESLGWVYAGLWQLSRDNRTVVWADGYYNGPPLDSAESMVPSSAPWLQRKSRRSLLEELQARSVDPWSVTSNLSNTEWFYLVSSSFTFSLGSYGTPAKMLVTGGFDWICDAGDVSHDTFSRSTIAKNAGMKTVLCLEVQGGVVELGTTRAVDQDIALVNFVQNMFQKGLETSKIPRSLSSQNDNGDDGLLFNHSASTNSKSSTPSPTNLGNSVNLPISSAGRGLGLAPPYQNSFTSASPLQQVESFGLDSMTFPPSLLNGLMPEHTPEPSSQQQHQQQQQNMNNMQQQSAAGSWDLSIEHQLMQDQNILPANLKHKLPGSTSVHTKSGSCVASFEQALFHPHAQHLPPQRGSLPVESPGKLISDFHAQLFSHQQQQNNLMQSPSETVVSDHSPRPSLNQTPDIHWRSVNQSKGMASPRTLLRVGSGKGLAPEVSSIDDSGLKCHQLASPSEDSHTQNNLPDLLRPSSHGHGHQPRYLADLAGEGHTQSADHSWSSEAISPTISEQEQEAENGYSLWEGTSDTALDNGRFLDGKMDRSKKARLCQGLNVNHQLNSNSISNFIMDERKRQENEKFQVLRAMLQPHSNSKPSDKAAVLGDAIELMKELQRRVKESESTTTSSASDEGQNPRNLERSSSLTTSFMPGVNHVNLRRDYNHNPVQQQYGGGDRGGNNPPLLKLSDVCLDPEEELESVVRGVVDDIPSIEVRMMENEQVMIKLSSKDRPGLFTDIMFALNDLQLQVQHANMRTVAGTVHDVFAAKMDVALFEKQTTQDIAEAIRRAIERGNSSNSCSPNPATPDANPNVNSPRKRCLQLT